MRFSASYARINLLVPMGYRRNKCWHEEKEGIHPSPWIYRKSKVIPVLASEALRVARG
jgi:hypothetical protein